MTHFSRITRISHPENGCSIVQTGTRLREVYRVGVILLLCCGLSVPGNLYSNPLEGTVRHGSVTIDDTLDGTLRIMQESDKAILDWRSFSIAAGELTEFVQPGVTSAALNRVSGGEASQIDGQLLANGRVFLLNPAGVLIGASGRVDAAGFVASTLDVSDEEFLSGGDLNFRGASTAAVVNLGAIGASEGDIFLIANRVENAGSLRAPNGAVGLAAGNDVLLAASGEERVFVRGSSGGAEGVVNSGTIEANVAELKAHGGNVYAMAIRNEGRVVARGVSKRGGQIFLGSPGGKIANEGELTVDTPPADEPAITVDAGPAPGSIENAGTIDAGGGALILLGHEIDLLAGSLVISDGPETGGSITIGSPESMRVNVESGATVSADGGTNGGSILLSGDSLVMDGAFSARGGVDGGAVSATGRELAVGGLLDAGGGVNGGTIMLSGVDFLTIDGNVSAIGDGGIGGSITATSENALTLGATGVIDAGGGGDGGMVLLDAGENGSAQIAGTVSAVGDDGVGGSVTVLGNELNVDGTARIDANGGAGGGAIFVGGGRRGKDESKRNSQNVNVASGAVFSADATSRGNGGEVIVFAEKALTFSGNVSAIGGAGGGNGGFVELSGRESVTIPNLLGQVDVGAANGTGGTLLIDPNDITIEAGPNPVTGPGLTGTTNENTLYADDIAAFLNGASLTIETTGTGGFGDITFQNNADISFASNSSLTLNADRDIIFAGNNDLIFDGSADTGGSTDFGLNATRDIDVSSANISITDGVMDFNAGRSVTVINSTLTINDGSIAIDANPTSDAGDFAGIDFRGTINASNGSDVVLTGTGGSDTGTSGHAGIEVSSSSVISALDSSTVSLIGTGAIGDQNNHGIMINNSQISTADGALTLTGVSSNASIGNNNDGIVLLNATLSSTGNGSVSLDGTGGGGADLSTGGHNGIVTFNSDISTAGTGELTLIGQGGGNASSTSGNNDGIAISIDSTIRSFFNGTPGGSAGQISFTGESVASGSDNRGVLIGGDQVSAESGSINIFGTAQSGNNNGVQISSANPLLTSSGDIMIAGQGSGTGFAISSSANLSAANGEMTLRSTGSDVAIGSEVTAADLTLGSTTGANFSLNNAANSAAVKLGESSTDVLGDVSYTSSSGLVLTQETGSGLGDLTVTVPTTEVKGAFSTQSGDVIFDGDLSLLDNTSFATNASGAGGSFEVTGDVGNSTAGTSSIPYDFIVNTGSGAISLGDLGTTNGALKDVTLNGGLVSVDTIIATEDVDLDATSGISYGSGTSSVGGNYTADAQNISFGSTVLNSVGDVSLTATLGVEDAGSSQFNLLNGSDLNIQAGTTISFDDTTIDMTSSGAGTSDLTLNAGSAFTAKASTFSVNSGSVAITGSNGGVAFNDTSLTASNATDVTINGTGASVSGASDNAGVLVEAGSNLAVADAGALSMTGIGGDGVDRNDGIRIDGSTVSTVDGLLTLDGTGAAGASGDDNDGVLLSSAQVTASGNGGIDIDGAGGSTASGDSSGNSGVSIINSSGVMTQGSGILDINGSSGGPSVSATNGLFNSGVQLSGGSSITSQYAGTVSLNEGSISLKGDSGSSEGIAISGTINSGTGNIDLDGRAQLTRTGVFLGTVGQVASANGDVRITGNSPSGNVFFQDIGATGGVSAVNGTVTFDAETGGVSMGGAVQADQLVFGSDSSTNQFDFQNTANTVGQLVLGEAGGDALGQVQYVNSVGTTLGLSQNGTISGATTITADEIALSGDLETIGGAIALNGDVSLDGAVKIGTTGGSAAGAAVTISGTVTNAVAGSGADFSVDAGTGNVTFSDSVGIGTNGPVANLSVSGQNLSMGEFGASGSATLTALGDISLSGTSTVGSSFSASAGRDISATGGGITFGGFSTDTYVFDADRSLMFDDFDLEAAGGAFTISNDGLGPASATAKGLSITNGSSITGGADVTITARGGNGAGGRNGLTISDSSIAVTDVANLQVTGSGGVSTTSNDSSGVSATNSNFSSEGGFLTINGTGSSNNTARGIEMSNVTVNSSDGGTVTLTGSVPNVGVGANRGISLTSNTAVSATGGSIVVEGTGGGGGVGSPTAQGVLLSGGSSITGNALFGSGGDVTISGTSTNAGSVGADLSGVIRSDGTLSITGIATNGDNTGLLIDGDSEFSGATEIELIGRGSGTGDAITMAAGTGGVSSATMATLLSQNGDIDFLGAISAPIIQVTSGGVSTTTIGLVSGNSFEFIGNAGRDVINFTDRSINTIGSLSIDGAGGYDLVDFSAITTGPVNLGIDSLSGIEELIGTGSAADEIIGSGAGDLFNINGAETGNVNGISFSSFERLSGGNGNDQFIFLPGGDLTGAVNGQGGSDVLFIDNRTNPTGKNYTILQNAVIGSQYDFLSIENVRISGGSGNDNFSTDFFPGFTQDLDGGGGTNTLTFRSVPDQRTSNFTSARGRAIQAAGFANFINLPPEPAPPGGTGGPVIPSTEPDATPDVSDVGALLQLETDQSMIFDQFGGNDENGIIDNFSDEGDGNDLLLVDLDGDGVDDTTGFAADGAERVGPDGRQPGRPFFVITPDGFVTFDMGAPPTLPTQQLLFGNVNAEAESELRIALGGVAEANIIDEDGVVAVDLGAPPSQALRQLLEEHLSPISERELREALGGSLAVGVGNEDGVLAIDASGDTPLPATENILSDNVTNDAKTELENALAN